MTPTCWFGRQASGEAWVTITIEENVGARALRRFLLGKCAESFRLAMAAYWLLAAAAEAEVRGDNHFGPSHALSTGMPWR